MFTAALLTVAGLQESPDQRDSAGEALLHKVKGCWFSPCRGSGLGCKFSPWSGPVLPGWGGCERQPVDVSLPHPCFSPSLSSSLLLSNNNQKVVVCMYKGILLNQLKKMKSLTICNSTDGRRRYYAQLFIFKKF